MSKSDEQLDRKPRKPASTASERTAAGKAYSHRFVDIELTVDSKAEFKALLADGEFASSTVDEFLQSGYSVKFTPSDGGRTSVCIVTCSVDGDPNNGLMLTGRGGDAATALAVVLFKDTYLCENGAWASGEDRVRQSGDNIA